MLAFSFAKGTFELAIAGSFSVIFLNKCSIFNL